MTTRSSGTACKLLVERPDWEEVAAAADGQPSLKLT
jgi:hypothetical protein